jgi:acid phosphatase type 7
MKCFATVMFGLVTLGLAALPKGPSLQSLTDNTVVVRWETSARLPGKVQYGLTSAYGSEASHADSVVDHELTLTGLVLDTSFHYRVMSGADTSADAVFRSMAGPEASFTFFAVSDNHSDSAAHQRVLNRILLNPATPVVLLNAGDFTGNSGATQYNTYFNIERPLLNRTVLYPAIGNHDIDTMAYWYRFFALPGNERYYSVRYGNSAFYCLNAFESLGSSSSQYQWLLAALRADSADPEVRHRFAWFHYPPYTTSTVYSGYTEARQYACPLFERYGVEVVFCGHVHAYEHSAVNGVHYITTGGGGASLSTGWNAIQPWTVYREACYEFVRIDVGPDSIVTRGIRVNGTEFDTLLLISTGARESRPAVGTRPRLTATPAVFRDRVLVTLDLERSGPTLVRVCDALGREIASLHSGTLTAGAHEFSWQPGALPSGVYFAQAASSDGTSTARLVRTR